MRKSTRGFGSTNPNLRGLAYMNISPHGATLATRQPCCWYSFDASLRVQPSPLDTPLALLVVRPNSVLCRRYWRNAIDLRAVTRGDRSAHARFRDQGHVKCTNIQVRRRAPLVRPLERLGQISAGKRLERSCPQADESRLFRYAVRLLKRT